MYTLINYKNIYSTFGGQKLRVLTYWLTIMAITEQAEGFDSRETHFTLLAYLIV
jgi:hypothetical protein